ncbi:MAG: 23S rRNA (uracil(1939)-C(5))-methyltransferase RlmD [Bacillota bacterium]
MQVGDVLEIEIEKIVGGGEGLARPADLPVIFVKNTLPGEVVEVKIIKKQSSYARGEVKKIIKSSSDRIEPDCPVYYDCGGCQLQHMSYAGQLKVKQNIIKEALERIGKLDHVFDFKVEGMDFPWYYRNKGQFPVDQREDKLISGFYRAGSHEIVVFPECKIQDQPINRLLNKIVDICNRFDISAYDESRGSGLLRHILIRSGICTGQLQLTLVTTNNMPQELKLELIKLPETEQALVSIYQNINSEVTNRILGDKSSLIYGQEYISDYIGKTKYLIHPESFFQVNTVQTEKLYEIVQKYAGLVRPDKIIDAFCGAGTISIYLADKFTGIIGIDSNLEAISAARKNSSLNQIEEKVSFRHGLVENHLRHLLTEDSLVIFDPPRKGLVEETVELIMQVLPQAIIYVSCNPSTLGRDLNKLKTRYKIREISAVDLFPQTYHVETVILLELKKS